MISDKNISIIQDKCIQCHRCEHECPTRSITFKRNDKGFLMPCVSDNCTKCGLCLRKCPVLNIPSVDKPIETLHGFSKEDNVRLSSSSGGMFYHIASLLKEEGWLVIGTVFIPQTKECKYVSSDKFDIKQMQKSKYCESNFSDVIPMIKSALEEKRKVLICGTPCHMYAIRQVFGGNNNLVVVDFLCHGVPSQELLKDDIEIYEKKHKSKISEIDFRFKKSKYSSNTLKISFKNGKSHVCYYSNDRFYYAFEKNWILRGSCYNCEFSKKHFSDITLGDFWQAEKYGVSADLKKGHSLVFVNTKKGQEVIDRISNQLVLNKTPEVIPYPSNSKTSNDINKQSLFFEYYKYYGFKKASDKLFFSKMRFKATIKKLLGKN